MGVTTRPKDVSYAEIIRVGKPNDSWVLTTALYFDAPRNDLWTQASLRFVRQLAERLGVTFSHFGIKLLERREGDLRGGYTYRWTPRNVERLEAAVSRGNLESLDLYFIENPKTDYMTHGPFGFLARFDPTVAPPGLIYLQLGPKLLGRWNNILHKEIYSIIQAFDGIADIRYGYVQPMALGKAPYVFPIGWSGAQTTRLEEKDNALWRRFQDDYRQQARNLYWGNLLTHEHYLLPFDTTLERIRDVVSADNVFTLSDDKVFFILPIGLESIENRDTCEHYHEMRGALEPYLRFMVPDEWVDKATSD